MYVYTHICVYMCIYLRVCVCVYIAISLCFSFLGRIWVTLLILAGLALTYWLAGLIWPWPTWVAGLQAVGLATADLQIFPKEVMQHVPPGHFCKPASPIAKLRWAPFLCVSTATPCASLHHFINILYWDNLSTLPSPCETEIPENPGSVFIASLVPTSFRHKYLFSLYPRKVHWTKSLYTAVRNTQ